MKSGIYEIVNIVNGKQYIGSAVNIKQRWHEHMKRLRTGKHINTHLQNSWNKYGESNFVFSIIEYVDKNNLIKREQYWLDAFNVVEEGYNIVPIAGSMLGYKFTDEQLKRLSESHKGQTSWLKGKKGYTNSGSYVKGAVKPKEVIEKMRASLKGTVPWNKGKKNCYSEETRKAMGAANIGNSHHKGKKHSETTKRKMSERARNISEDTRQRMSAAQKARDPATRASNKGQIPWNKGKKNCYSEETRRSISNTKKGSKASDATRRKMSEAQKLRWAKIKSNKQDNEEPEN